MRYTPPKLPLPKTGKAMTIYISDDRRSAAAYVAKPEASVHVEQPFKGGNWWCLGRDGKGIVTFNGCIEGSADAKPREVLASVLEELGLR